MWKALFLILFAALTCHAQSRDLQRLERLERLIFDYDPAAAKANYLVDVTGQLTQEQSNELRKMLANHNMRHTGKIHLFLLNELPEAQSVGGFAEKYLTALEATDRAKDGRVVLVAALDHAQFALTASARLKKYLPEQTCADIVAEIKAAHRPTNPYLSIRQGLSRTRSELGFDFQLSPAYQRKLAVVKKVGLVILFCLLWAPLLTILHEGGHALVAWLVGLHLRVVSLGYGPQLYKTKLGGVTFELNRFPLSGYVMMWPDKPEGFRWRLWLATFAGPATHLLLLLALFAAGGWHFLPNLSFPVAVLYYLNLFYLVVNLFPHRFDDETGYAYSDGYHLTKIPFYPDEVLALYRTLQIQYEAVEYRRANQPERALALYKRELQHQPENLDLRFGLANTYLHLGAYEKARRCFVQVLDNFQALPPAERNEAFRLALLNTIAYTNLLLRRGELLAEADCYSEEALRLMPAALACAGTRGAVLLRLGHLSQGLVLLHQTYSQHSEPQERADEACWLALGYALQKNHATAGTWLAIARQGPANPPLLRQTEDEIKAIRLADAYTTGFSGQAA